MGVPMKYDVSQILKAKEALASLPKISIESKDQVTAMEAIVLLSDELSALKKKGYSTPLLVKALHDQGVNVTAGTLRLYLRKAGAGPPRANKEKAKAERGPAKESTRPASKKVAGPSSAKPANQPDSNAATKSSKFAVRGDTDDL